MWDWFKYGAFKWCVRLGILVVGCASMQHILVEQLGYRMDIRVMLTVALITIVTVRFWMPWDDD